MNATEKLFEHIGKFKQETSAHAMKIIDKMHDPNKKSAKDPSILELDFTSLSSNQQALVLIDSDHIFVHNNIIYQLASRENE